MERTALLEKLNLARPCLSTQDIVPILSHFCFTDEEIIAFNGVQGIIVDHETELDCGLPGELLIKLLSSYSSDKLVVKQKKEEINIKVGKSTAKLASLPNADFIFEMPDVEDLPSFTVTEDFLNGISKASISVSRNALQRSQFGVTLISDKKQTNLYSTDNNRISRYTLEDSLGKKAFKILLPELFCQMLVDVSKSLEDPEAEVYMGEDFVLAVFEGVYIYSKLLVDVDYLDFEAVIDANWDGEEDNFQETPEAFVTAIERTVLLTSKEQDQVVHLDSEDDTLQVSGKGIYGNIDEDISFDNDISDGELSCRMDANLLLDALKAVDEMALCESIGEDKVPMFVGRSDKFFHLLMAFKED